MQAWIESKDNMIPVWSSVGDAVAGCGVGCGVGSNVGSDVGSSDSMSVCESVEILVKLLKDDKMIMYKR